MKSWRTDTVHGTVEVVRNAARLLTLLTLFVAVVGYTLLGYFQVHTRFVNTVVAEPAPVFATTTDDSAHQPAFERTPGKTEHGAGSGRSARPDGGKVLIQTAFRSEEGHIGRGTVTVYSDGGMLRVLRFGEDFTLGNGPDLHVLIGNPQYDWDDPHGWIDLGELKGNIGSQNYLLPRLHPETNVPVTLDTFDTVIIRSVRFGDTYAIAYLES